ncbi:hypothetical protein F4861DRAFT_373980 [Xylaria intraflava]|nr:hypothetical protein F4861DRAFT_373980 [Xylaria intraflava]
MPLKREPSQRLNWVKWNSSKTGSNSGSGSGSGSNSKRVTAPEIVHLGGARVSPEPYSADKHFTRRTTEPQPPNPPAIGLAVTSHNDYRHEPPKSPTASDNDRPITQWFPTWQLDIAKSKYESQDPPSQPTSHAHTNSTSNMTARSNMTSSSNMTTSSSLNSNPNSLSTSNTDAAEDKYRSPSRTSTSSNANLPNSPPEVVSPSISRTSSPLGFAEPNQSRPVQFPKRSTSLSQSSRYAPPRLTKRAMRAGPPLKAKEVHLRRTQSNAEVQRPTPWSGSPPRLEIPVREDKPTVREASPPRLEIPDRPRTRESSPAEPRHHVDPRRGARSPVNPVPDRLQVIPPLRGAPPNIPLPPISAARRGSHGKTREQAHAHARGLSFSSDHSSDVSPCTEAPGRKEDVSVRVATAMTATTTTTTATTTTTRQRLTGKERLWLHRNYRGEANFLKAWGLGIASEDDRAEGVGILRELMEAEAQEEREGREGGARLHSRSGSLSRGSATNSPARESAGLGVIAEERHSREFHLRSSTRASSEEGGGGGGGDDSGDRWAAQRGRNGRELPESEKHSSQESGDSVLEEYLDFRLDRDH